MDRIQMLSVMLALLFFILVFGFIKRQRFRERQAFLWIMLAGAGVLTAAAIPVLNRAAEKVGIAYMPTLIFVLAFFAVLTLLMLHSATLSREQERLKLVVQELAVLRQEVEDMRELIGGQEAGKPLTGGAGLRKPAHDPARIHTLREAGRSTE
jgi:hypothetical protein